jgi:protein-S-isoprenylcysteine O-methyltransferase Ste14
MLALFRSIVYAALFISVVLVFVPGQILTGAGITRPTDIGSLHWTGLALVGLGGALAIWCIITFALVGQGTPAPFDPPRKLVTGGPYRWTRNPMYVGADTALVGAALYYQSAALVAFAAAFLVMTHVFVVFFEEPTLERTFGAHYADYRNAVPRWLPTWRS